MEEDEGEAEDNEEKTVSREGKELSKARLEDVVLNMGYYTDVLAIEDNNSDCALLIVDQQLKKMM